MGTLSCRAPLLLKSTLQHPTAALESKILLLPPPYTHTSYRPVHHFWSFLSPGNPHGSSWEHVSIREIIEGTFFFFWPLPKSLHLPNKYLSLERTQICNGVKRVTFVLQPSIPWTLFLTGKGGTQPPAASAREPQPWAARREDSPCCPLPPSWISLLDLKLVFQLKIMRVWLRSSTNYCGLPHSDQVPERGQSFIFWEAAHVKGWRVGNPG